MFLISRVPSCKKGGHQLLNNDPLCLFTCHPKLKMFKTAQQRDTEKKNWKGWFRQLGVAGFLFFLVKGLVWLAVFFGLFKACGTPV